MKKFAVVLAGCGVYDGAEIHEAVLTLLAIRQQGAEYKIFAPDVPQYHVKNHITGKDMPETRNVLVESARIARGKIRPLQEFNPGRFDALIFPGGFGVAKNLCTYAFDGASCTVNQDVEKAVMSMLALHKPVGAMCIAPVFLAKLLKDARVTIGEDPGTARDIEKMGGRHVGTTHGEVVYDAKYNLFTTPCYMLDADIDQIFQGTRNIVREMLIKM